MAGRLGPADAPPTRPDRPRPAQPRTGCAGPRPSAAAAAASAVPTDQPPDRGRAAQGGWAAQPDGATPWGPASAGVGALEQEPQRGPPRPLESLPAPALAELGAG